MNNYIIGYLRVVLFGKNIMVFTNTHVKCYENIRHVNYGFFDYISYDKYRCYKYASIGDPNRKWMISFKPTIVLTMTDFRDGRSFEEECLKEETEYNMVLEEREKNEKK